MKSVLSSQAKEAARKIADAWAHQQISRSFQVTFDLNNGVRYSVHGKIIQHGMLPDISLTVLRELARHSLIEVSGVNPAEVTLLPELVSAVADNFQGLTASGGQAGAAQSHHLSRIIKTIMVVVFIPIIVTILANILTVIFLRELHLN